MKRELQIVLYMSQFISNIRNVTHIRTVCNGNNNVHRFFIPTTTPTPKVQKNVIGGPNPHLLNEFDPLDTIKT